jgi:hypothetical protein
MHDWWAYQVITGVGGQVIHDDEPVLLYRQHAANEVGANHGVKAKMHRLLGLLRGDLRTWNDTNIAALKAMRGRLTPTARVQLDAFARLRRSRLVTRVRGVRQLGLYRQSRAGRVSLIVAACLGRL